MRAFRWLVLRRLRQEPLRAGLTVVGVALGIAVVLAIRLANASSVQGFAAALDLVAGRTSLEIVSPGTGLDETRVADLGWLREFGDVSPVIEGDAVLTLDGRGIAMRVLGIDILRDEPFRDYTWIELESGPDAPRAQDVLRLLTEPDSVFLSEPFARRYGLGVGSIVVMAFGDRVRRMTVRGLIGGEGPAQLRDGQIVLMDIAAAQWAFDRLGTIDRLDVRLREGSGVDEAEAAVAARLPEGLAAQRPARRGAQVERMLEAFHFNLGALSWVALIVGLFLIHNTVAVSVITRREEIGVLRAVGMRRRSVLLLFLGEAVVLALAGALAGVGLGWVLARGAVALTSSTVSTLYVAGAAAVPALTVADVLLAVSVGLPLALVAAAGPALEAAGVTPLAAIRGADRAEDRGRWRPRQMALAVALLAAAAGFSRLGPVDGRPVFGFVAALCVVFGVAAIVPGALVAIARVTRGPMSRVFALEGRLAHANLAASVPRLSVSVAALGVALSMMVAIAVMVGSFRETVVYWVNQTLQADLYLATARRSNLDGQATISEALESAVVAEPSVRAVDRFRSVNLPYQDRLIVLGSGDFGVMLAHGRLVYKAPADGRAALAAARDLGGVVVSESFALRFGRGVGDSVTLPTPSGPATFRIHAVYYDYATDRGTVVMDRATFARHFGDARPTSLAIYLEPGSDAEAVRDGLLASLGDDHRVFIHTNRSLRAEVLRIFDGTFAITWALEGIAVLVAILGVAGTLVTLVLERRREIAMLRLVGAERRQVRRMVVIEAGLLGGVSQALGVVAGLALAALLVFVINVQSFGWTIQFHVPVAFLAQSALVVLAATALSGLYPAHLAAGLATDELVEE